MQRFIPLALAALALALMAPRSGLVAEEPAAKQTGGTKLPTTPANRLAKETSPYLLLHAHNPVDWYPWGDEALAKAKAETKLIFLSVGYSSCYWCHVMERESFMDPEIAALLNKHFVCIKVDREERPDIDEIYMQALRIYMQLVGSKQGGGWPLSMFLTPNAKPLMGGTYFPPRDKDGRMGFLAVLGRVQEAWSADPEKWQKTGESLASYVAESLRQRPLLKVVKLEPALVDSVVAALAGQFDATYGGWGYSAEEPRRPKFPDAPNLTFLLDYHRRRPSSAATTMLVTTLEKMSQGGIRDHVGGGFHRYSTDRFWRVPHFEKMLYDNAQLTTVYTAAYEATPRADFKRVVDESIAFVLRELTDADGGFYSALDAETDSHEGIYYVWQRGEVEAALTPEEYALWSGVYGLGGEPNFEGRYIPLLDRPLAAVAEERKLTLEAIEAQLTAINAKLLAVRSQRKRPLTDTKILTAWNGLMIRALADAGRIFENLQYTAVAARAADFILTKSRDAAGHLQRTVTDKQAKVPAYLDDYAFLIDGLIALHRATGEARWLQAAGELMEAQLPLFSDDRVGGFFNASTLHEQLIARSKVPTDTVIPSGNSMSAINLLHLAAALNRPEYVARAEKCIQSATPILVEQPAAVVQLATAVSAWLDATATATEPDAKK